MNVITFHVPPRFRNPEGPSREVVEMEWRQGWSLGQYYATTRYTYHLSALNQRLKVRRMPSREPVRTSYVPNPGETFVFLGANQSLG